MTPADASETESAPALSAGQLLRRLLVFQVKLALDGLRDLLLSPVSIIAVLWGLMAHPRRPEGPFRRLLGFGRRTDAWIDLFESHDDAAGEGRSANRLIDAAEQILREEFEGGGGLDGARARLRTLRPRSAAQPAPSASSDEVAPGP